MEEKKSAPQPFNKFLAQLNSGSEIGVEEYENLRRKLISFFKNNRCTDAETLTDETIDRVVAKIEQKEITSSLFIYSLGVARNVLREYTRKISKTAGDIDNLPCARHPKTDPHTVAQQEDDKQKKETKLNCLKYCLEQLAVRDYKLFIQYYGEEERAGETTNRSLLAEWYGISVNNLRVKMHRMRDRLRKCIEDCILSKQ